MEVMTININTPCTPHRVTKAKCCHLKHRCRFDTLNNKYKSIPSCCETNQTNGIETCCYNKDNLAAPPPPRWEGDNPPEPHIIHMITHTNININLEYPPTAPSLTGGLCREAKIKISRRDEMRCQSLYGSLLLTKSPVA